MLIRFFKVPQALLACLQVMFQVWGSMASILASFIFFPFQLIHEKLPLEKAIVLGFQDNFDVVNGFETLGVLYTWS